MLSTEASSKVATMQSLWLELLQINELLGKPQLDGSGIDKFEAMASMCGQNLHCLPAEQGDSEHSCNAMHSHVGQFLRQHGGLLPFTQQGIEKYNDHLTKTHFR